MLDATPSWTSPLGSARRELVGVKAWIYSFPETASVQFKVDRFAEPNAWLELVRGVVSNKVLKCFWLQGLLQTPRDLVSIFFGF